MVVAFRNYARSNTSSESHEKWRTRAMHRDMRKELQSTAARDLEQEQNRFDKWKTEFNYERPHEALGLITPAECYQPSEDPYDSSEPEYQYPDLFETRMVCSFGKFNWNIERIFLTKVSVQAA